MQSLGDNWRRGQQLLSAAGIDAARLEVRLMLESVAACRHTDLLTDPERLLDATPQMVFDDWLARRVAGEPLAYLLGEAEFRGRVFQVSPAVLIPRPETEVLVDLALEKLRDLKSPTVLELGTGSGIIAISLALECPAAQIVTVDVSNEAIFLARNNAGRLRAKLDCRVGDWFLPVPGERFDLIVSNPPYIAEADPHLELNGLPFEPRLALTDQVPNGDGLACIRHIVAHAAEHLQPGGWLLFEHGYDQGPASRNLLTAAGFKAAFTHPDLAGIDRVSGAYF